jgi:hypothetical protein
MNTIRLLTSVLGILVFSTPALVNANTISYGTLVGSSVNYSNVSETSLSIGDSAPLYGAPILVGDSLVFNAMTFSSQAANGATDITDGKLDATIASKNNTYINSILFQEFGDATLAGTGTSATRSSVGNSIFVTVLAVDNLPIFPQFISVNMAMSPTNQWTLAGGPLTGQLWNGTLNLNLSGIVTGDVTGHVTKVSISMDNTLTTSSELNTQAFIAKKAAGLSVTPEIIPEPSVISLLVLSGALLVVGWFGRKSS